MIQRNFKAYEKKKKAAKENTTTTVEENKVDGTVTTTTTTTTKVETVVVNKSATTGTKGTGVYPMIAPVHRTHSYRYIHSPTRDTVAELHQEAVHLVSTFSDIFTGFQVSRNLETWKPGNLHNSLLFSSASGRCPLSFQRFLNLKNLWKPQETLENHKNPMTWKLMLVFPETS